MAAQRAAIGIFIGLLALGEPAIAARADNQTPPSIDLARSLIEAEQFEKAVDVLKHLDAEDASTSARIDLLFGQIYLAIGKPAKALGFFEDASFASLDNEAEAYLGLAEADLALGDLAKARRNASLALKSDSDLIAAHLVLARADQRIGRTDLATARIRELQRNRPDSEAVAVILARYRSEQDGPAAGIADLRHFVGLYPTAAGAWDALGQLLWISGRKVDAVEAKATARQQYLERGQNGRAAVVVAWLNAVDPQGRLKPRGASLEAEPRPQPPVEPPAPRSSPRPSVKTVPLPPPPPNLSARPTPAAVLSHPEPLPFAPGTPIMTGSGLVLEGGRQVLTNRHVVEGFSVIAVRNGTGHVRKARVLRLSQVDDLALLELDRPFPEGAAMPLGDIVDPAPGRSAIVMGFPIISLFGDEQPALTEGIVAKTTGLADDPNTFQMTAKLNKGNSGGPVFDRRGHLIGLAVGKVDSAGIYQKSGTLVEDMNLGIKGDRLLRFLDKPAAAEAAAPEMNLEDLYQQMLPRAVLIAAVK